MGFGIMLKKTVHSRFYLAHSLQYLAYFGILHGVSDWGNIFIPLQKSYLNHTYIYVLESIKMVINATSFFFLFYFGIHLLVKTKKWNKAMLFAPLFILLVWVSNFIFLEPYLVNKNNQEWWFAISDIWARYLLAFPGAVISSYALFLQRKQFYNLGVPRMTRTLKLAVVSVGLYGLSGGLIVPYAPVLPAIFFNSRLFFNTTGIPVELFRGLSGLLMAFFILKILQVFDIEYQNYYYQAEKQKAITNERNKIARDIHDGMIQSIYAMGLNLERIRNMLADKSNDKIEQSEAELQGVIKKLNDIIREIRGYIKQLQKSEEQIPDFKEQIKKLIVEMGTGQHMNLTVKYNYNGAGPPLSQTVQIYYIIKEALSNILRHAEATEGEVIVEGNNQEYFIEIIDNGKGMDESDYNTNEKSYFLKQGINNMTYRAQAIGGDLIIKSEKGKGTKITLHVKNGGIKNAG